MKGDEGTQLVVERYRREILQLDVDVKASIARLRDSAAPQHQLTLTCRQIKQQLKLLEENVEQLHACSLQVRARDERTALQEEVAKHREHVALNLQELRKATLLATQAAERQSRDQLLADAASSPAAHASQSANLRQRSARATDSLSSLVSKMGEQVKQSEETLDTLVGSSQRLRSVEQEFDTMGATVDSSGKLLSKYARRELTDKILITLTLCLFFAAVLYIIKKRLFPTGFW